MPPETHVKDVLKQYPTLVGGTLVPLGNHGGFSGARLWRVETPVGNFALKAMPPDWRSGNDLQWIHGLMAQASVHAWMPRVIATNSGATFASADNRLWEVVTWMPGVADYRQAPSPARLQSAATALAQLHQAWGTGPAQSEVCPAVRRRVEALQTWTNLVQTGWRPAFAPLDPHANVAERLWQIVTGKIDAVPMMLSAWVNRKVPVQPCLCDLWHDHVLFTGDAVTGIIDFGSTKVDHVTVDLARLFGSLVGNDDAAWQAALAAYEKVRPLTLPDRMLARVLDRTGVLLAATNWLRWLYHDMRVYPDSAAANARLEAIAKRLQS
jgi:Ser/Thr protein kinase RdoA (MazF antagonist)